MNYYQKISKQQIIIVNCVVTQEIFAECGYSKYQNGNFIVNNEDIHEIFNKKIDLIYSDNLFINNITQLLVTLNECYLSLNISFSAVLSFEDNTVIIEKSNSVIEDKRNNAICRIFISNRKENIIYNYNIDQYIEEKILKLIKNIRKKSKKSHKENKSYKKIFMNNQSITFMEGSGGYLIHETLGHLVESDYILNKYSIIGNNYKLGDVIGNESLNVHDDPSKCKEIINLGKYDDEGEIMEKIEIIKDGIFTGILCNKKDSEKYEKNFAGCSRRESYQHKGIPRMRNTFIVPNIDGMDAKDILKHKYKGIAVNQIYSGFVNPITGEFQLHGEGYRINKGKISNKIKKLVIQGNIIQSLKNISNIGNDFIISPGYCVKLNQTVPVCIGSPTIEVEGLNIIGELYD